MAFGTWIGSDVNTAITTSQSAIDTARGGLSAVLGGSGVTNQAVENMNSMADKITKQGTEITNLAPQVKEKYDALSPIANLLGGYGSDLWNEGQSLSAQAKDVFGQGGALVNMDPSAGGLAGEFIKYWNSLSPDRYVSQAASDTQSSYENAKGQAERDLSRRGVSASSGAYGALQKQYTTALATALSAAKTKARQVGLDQQAAQLDKMVGAANTLYNMGNQTESQALAAKSAAGSMIGKQADVVTTQAAGYKSIGDLFASAASLFGSAGSMYGNAASLNNNYLNLVKDAYGQVANAQNALADTQLRGISLLAGRGGGGGGTTISNPRNSDEESNSPTGAWVDLTHGKASHADGATWIWDPNAMAE